jgi:TIR domain
MAALGEVRFIPERKPHILRVFISYAKEDEKIAVAAFEAIRTALGTFADVFIDTALQFGVSFQDEIRKRLDETELLVVVYSAALKPSHSFTGMELGYFIGTMERNQQSDRPRRIVPIYLDNPPDILSGNEGINIGISRATLELSLEEYSEALKIDSENRMVKFLSEFQEIVDKLREENGFPKVVKRPEEEDLCGLVRKMQLSIFNHLKTTPESTLKPQKQVTIKTQDFAIDPVRTDLPDDAVLVPVGTGIPMSIFGLQDREITWGEFKKLTKSSKFRDSWIDAITGVVASSLQGQLDVDNSQVIVSNDERHAFRVILTTGTRYFNGTREFSLYFVEYLRPRDFGDASTTLVLKGLELSCRFRFLFLERNSEFAQMNIRIALPNRVHELGRSIERELNLLRRDSVEMGLDKANIWADFVDWQYLQKMSEVWRPLETKVRDICVRIRAVKEDSEEIPGLRDSLADTIKELESEVLPLNTQLICALTDSLKKFCSCQ